MVACLLACCCCCCWVDSVADEENETQAQVSVYAENNFINTAKNFVNRVRSIAPTFQDVINRARQIGNLARSVPVVGDFVGAHIAMANMLKQMIKVRD